MVHTFILLIAAFIIPSVTIADEGVKLRYRCEASQEKLGKVTTSSAEINILMDQNSYEDMLVDVQFAATELNFKIGRGYVVGRDLSKSSSYKCEYIYDDSMPNHITVKYYCTNRDEPFSNNRSEYSKISFHTGTLPQAIPAVVCKKFTMGNGIFSSCWALSNCRSID